MWVLTSMRPSPAKSPPWFQRGTTRLTGRADAPLAPVTAGLILPLTQVKAVKGMCYIRNHVSPDELLKPVTVVSALQIHAYAEHACLM